MKQLNVIAAAALAVIFFGCNNPKPVQVKISDTASTPAANAADVGDNRPKDELQFLNRVKAESDYEVTSNAAKKDMHITAFNKYALDSLKKIANWEMIVTEVNDNNYDATSVAKKLFDLENNPVYNVVMVAPIKIDNRVDTIAIDNRVDFTITIPKNAKSDTTKKQLNVIKTLSKGDTVIVSGALTHLNDNAKVDFAPFYDQSGPWNIDVLSVDIRKKGSK